MGNPLDITQSDISLSSLDSAHIGAIQPALGRKPLLRKTARAAEFTDARACWRAARPDERAAELAELDAFAVSLAEGERFPEPFVQSADLARLGVPKGPHWSALLAEGEVVPPEPRCLIRALARIARPARTAVAPDQGELPAALRLRIAKPIRDLRWRPVLPGLSECRLDGFHTEAVGLMRADPGTPMRPPGCLSSWQTAAPARTTFSCSARPTCWGAP